MGIIYEALRKLNNEIDDDDYNDEYDKIFIDFPNFLGLLELYSSDDKHIIANYLHSSKDFLALDYYESDDEYKIVRTEYDDEKSGAYCPIEAFLDDVNGGRLSDYNGYYWDIEELLSLECIKFINLDREAFDACYDAMFIEASTALQYKIENAKLKNQIDALNKIQPSEIANDDNLTGQLYQQIAELEKQLSKAHTDNDLLRKKVDSNKELEPNSQAAIARLLNVLFYKADYDITAHQGTTNAKIQKQSKETGTPVGEKFISKWIKIVNSEKMGDER